MEKLCSVLGLMSGTSMDGIDLAIIRTDGHDTAHFVAASFVPYPPALRTALRAILGHATDPDGTATQSVTNAHIAAVQAFLAKTGHKPDLIGFHGQTIFHAPARGITTQLGDGPALAKALNIPVIYNFRQADIDHGGQGAPLIPLYHQVLAKNANLQAPIAILNLGGVANFTYIDGDNIIACDSGPACALIDDLMLARTGQSFDKNGQTALTGTPDMPRVQRWLTHPYFSAPAPKSLDRNAFAACTVDDLNLPDAAATLAAFTVHSTLKTLALMPKNVRTLVLTGGGRHNAALMQGFAKHINTINADDLSWRGDSMEAEGFAYLAKRALGGLPLSLPTTTGCQTPCTGGTLVRPN